MGESSKFPKSRNFEISILKNAVCQLNIYNFKFKWSVVLRQTENKSERLNTISLIQHFEDESHPKNPDLRNNPENFHPCQNLITPVPLPKMSLYKFGQSPLIFVQKIKSMDNQLQHYTPSVRRI